jgi:hypothetical protein
MAFPAAAGSSRLAADQQRAAAGRGIPCFSRNVLTAAAQMKQRSGSNVWCDNPAKRAPTQDSPELQCSLHNLMGIHIRRGVKKVSPLSLLASRPEISNLAIISIPNLTIISPTSILSNLDLDPS